LSHRRRSGGHTLGDRADMARFMCALLSSGVLDGVRILSKSGSMK
jgi:hypothetical protein